MNQEFAENIKNHIREYLPVDYQDAKITLEKVTKGNDRILTGLIIRKDDETAVPSIYLEHYEEQFGKGRPMDDIMKEIAQIKMENSLELPIDVKGLQDYETARPLLAIRLCDPEKNQEYLKDKPHTACGELAATYRIQIMEDSSGTASAVVTNDMLNLWGITPEQLHHDTVSAENARNPVCLYTMDDVMSEIMLSVKPENLFEQTEPLESEMIPMYILTNQNKVNGAGVLARDGVLDKIGELLGSDFYVLPSSTHEVILVPDNGNMQTTNAKRYMSTFSQRPFETWKVIEENIQPYMNKLGIAERRFYENLLNDIYELFEIDSFKDNKKLDGLYLLGFHSQAYDLKLKKEDSKEKEEEE